MSIDRNTLIGALSSSRYLPAEQAEEVADLILGRRDRKPRPLPLHRTEATVGLLCSTCDGGGCPDCTDPA